jgi:hypothetical protein
VRRHHSDRGLDPAPALQALTLDRALCPRTGSEHTLHCEFSFDAASSFHALSAMEQPASMGKGGATQERWQLRVKHPGGVGDMLLVADGGSWLAGTIGPDTMSPDVLATSAASAPVPHHSLA